jgi:UPF0755 protein
MALDLKKIIKYGSVIIITVLLAFAIKIYLDIFTDNTKFNQEEVYVYVPTNSNYDQVKEIIAPFIKNMDNFETIAQKRSYPQNVKSGKFLFTKGMSSFALLSALRKNVPVRLAFNNQERLENFVQRVSSQIEPDSTKLVNAIKDSAFLKQNGFTADNVLGMFLPNTYEVYWNISADKFRDKMIKEYRNFWTNERLEKAKKLGLSPIEVITLASIVHKETVKADERPRIAKVYLNRLELGMPLQADPTVIYALKARDNDFNQVIKRVLYGDLTISSPYNTYVNLGLPPGPIAMPDINAIDAVLNPEDNDYIYFCASVEKFGYHEFASTLSQHNVNASNYAKWLNEQGTKR